MKMKMAFATVVFTLLVVQAQTVFADIDSDFFEAFYRTGDLNLAKRLLERGADINKRNSWFRSVRETTPFIKNGTILMLSAINGKFDKVIFLIDNGAKVNLRDDFGATAASLSYDAGEIEIFNYLKKNGAINFEPKQATPEQTVPILSYGTYSCVNLGRNMTMVIRADLVTYSQDGYLLWSGTYTINDKRIAIIVLNTAEIWKHLSGDVYNYNVNSEKSFSSNGENWIRTGY
jgi:ankyrin repeat protein